jgi:uncharacterized ParB-like nuclease family protein
MEILAALVLGVVVYCMGLALYYAFVGCPREVPDV